MASIGPEAVPGNTLIYGRRNVCLEMTLDSNALHVDCSGALFLSPDSLLFIPSPKSKVATIEIPLIDIEAEVLVSRVLRCDYIDFVVRSLAYPSPLAGRFRLKFRRGGSSGAIDFMILFLSLLFRMRYLFGSYSVQPDSPKCQPRSSRPITFGIFDDSCLDKFVAREGPRAKEAYSPLEHPERIYLCEETQNDRYLTVMKRTWYQLIELQERKRSIESSERKPKAASG
mmetsp:Transcript_18274/g.30031  ORF Transcript_18274/g.30031 Transcript_18274/m.30031 type:complete len:228 (-) Transcript_18274:446-1129(-)